MIAEPWDELGITPLERADALEFARAGFRAYSLCGDGWRLVLSRVDVADREPKGLVTVFSAGHPQAFRDLDGYVLSRTVGLFGGTNLRNLAGDLSGRIGGDVATWSRRLDYLAQRTMREAQVSGEAGTIVGRPDKPAGGRYVFAGRVRQGRTVSLFGPGSAGKTTIADGLLVSADTGREIIPGWIPTARFVVGLLDWDEGIDEARVRVHAIAAAYDLELNGYHYRRMGRPLADSADEVGRWVVDQGIEVLVISPVNRALRAANGDPGGPVFELYEVLRELGTTNILIDHVVGSAIDGAVTASREYGSVAKRDAARGSYSVYQQFEAPGRRVVVLRNTKPDALAPRHDPQAVRIEFDPPYPDITGTYDRISFHEDVFAEVVNREASSETQPQKLVRILREHGKVEDDRRTLTKIGLCALGGFEAKSLHTIAHKARGLGFAVTGEGDEYVLTLPLGT